MLRELLVDDHDSRSLPRVGLAERAPLDDRDRRRVKEALVNRVREAVEALAIAWHGKSDGHERDPLDRFERERRVSRESGAAHAGQRSRALREQFIKLLRLSWTVLEET